LRAGVEAHAELNRFLDALDGSDDLS